MKALWNMSIDATSLCQLGNTLYQQGRRTEALVAYEKSLEIKPDYPAALNNRGVTLLALKEPVRALESFDAAIALHPTFAEAFYNKANTERQLQRFTEALESYEHAVAIKSNYAEAFNNRGNVLQELGRSQDALKSYEKALDLDPYYIDAIENKGILLVELGLMAAARQSLETVLSIAPRRARAHFHLIRIKRMTRDDPQLPVLEALEREKGALGESSAIDINFALGKAYDDIGDYELAFARFARGNALKRTRIQYHEAGILSLLNRTSATFTKDKISARRGWGDASAAPIFIFGMPRSGSTLVEQILSRHPKISARGESDAFSESAAGVMGLERRSLLPPKISSDLSSPQLQEIARRYLRTMDGSAGGQKRTTDKNLSNFFYAGLIHLAMPNARLIHTRRDPVDTCWSCFSQRFGESGAPPFAYDLGEVGRFYRSYDILMQHWRRVLPEGELLTVDYEDVVADIEGQARKILAYCGLEWDSACLTFYKGDRHVRTASAGQVARPIYKDAIGRWRNYEGHLQPLLDELAPMLTGHGTAMAANGS